MISKTADVVLLLFIKIIKQFYIIYGQMDQIDSKFYQNQVCVSSEFTGTFLYYMQPIINRTLFTK